MLLHKAGAVARVSTPLPPDPTEAHVQVVPGQVPPPTNEDLPPSPTSPGTPLPGGGLSPPAADAVRAAPARSGAILQSYADRWSSAPSLLKTTVRRGYHWEWTGSPPPLALPSFTQSQPHLHAPIQEFLQKGIIALVPHQPCYLSRIFTVPRKDGGNPRIIIDLSQLNSHITVPPITFENHTKVARNMIPPVVMASLDIREAYTHIPIRPNLQKYLAFSFRNQLFFFRALPFGLCTAPFIFTKILSWPIQYLRTQGISIVAYLDDVLLWNRSPTVLNRHLTLAIMHLQQLGFIIHPHKSSLVPQPVMQWLGIMWHGQTGHWCVPPLYQQQIATQAQAIVSQHTTTRRTWEALLGTLNFACQVHRHLRVHLQPLCKAHLLAPAAQRDKVVKLPEDLHDALLYWTTPLPWTHTPRFQSSAPLNYLWTDASTEGWGAYLGDNSSCRGVWSQQECKAHINVLELRAVRLALRHFAVSDCQIVLHTDSEVVRCVIVKSRARSPTLLAEYALLSHWCVERHLHLSATRIPTHLNVIADGLSRGLPLDTEWRLPRHSFLDLTRWHGEMDVDLFSTPLNAQLAQFVTPFPHPRAVATNALTFNWNRFQAIYLFPPVNLLPQVLQRLSSYKGRAILVAPWDPTAPWFPVLLQMASGHLHLLTEVYQHCLGGKVIHSSKLSKKWTGFSF